MRTRAAAAGTAVLAVAGLLVALTALWPRPDTGSPIRAVEPGPSAALERRAPHTAPHPASNEWTPTAPRATRSAARPERLEIASVGIDVTVKPVGVSPDGQMALPPNPEVLGWYRFGPSPGGGTGSAVVAGHLDSKRYGLGPLVGLREVDAGDPSRRHTIGRHAKELHRGRGPTLREAGPARRSSSRARGRNGCRSSPVAVPTYPTRAATRRTSSSPRRPAESRAPLRRPTRESRLGVFHTLAVISLGTIIVGLGSLIRGERSAVTVARHQAHI